MLELIQASWSLSVIAVVIGAVIGYAKWKRRQFTGLDYDEQEFNQVAHEMLIELRDWCAGPGIPIPVHQDLWARLGWTKEHVLKLLQYMCNRGWITLPDYDIGTQVVWGITLPSAVSLTPHSYEKYSEKPASAVFNGPAHFGSGDQVIGTLTYQQHELALDLDRLAGLLRIEAQGVNHEMSVKLSEIADALSEPDAVRAPDIPRTRLALQWLMELANGTAANLISSAIISSATSILGRLH